MLKDIATLFIRFFSAYIAFGAATVLLGQLALSTSMPDDYQDSLQLYLLGYLVSIFIVSALLWHFSVPLAGQLTKNLSNELQLPEPEGLVMAGSFLIGSYWVLTHITGAVLTMISLLAYEPSVMDGEFTRMGARQLFTDGHQIGAFLIAITMMLGVKQIGLLFSKLRRLGSKAHD